MKQYKLTLIVASIAVTVGCWPPAPPKPTPQPTPEPTVEPTPTPTPPPVSACPKPLEPGARVYVAAKRWGQGQDSTIRVAGDKAFCQAIHGVPDNDCHLEGWPTRTACELELAGGCPIWQYRVGELIRPCLQTANEPALSCDHFGSPPADMRDDPQTPQFEGKPAECGLQRDGRGEPKAGFFIIAHGLGDVRACLPDATNCSNWIAVNH